MVKQNSFHALYSPLPNMRYAPCHLQEVALLLGQAILPIILLLLLLSATQLALSSLSLFIC